MGQVTLPSLRIPVLATPPGEDVSTKGGEVAPPASPASPVVVLVLGRSKRQDLGDFLDRGPGDEVETDLGAGLDALSALAVRLIKDQRG